VVESPAAVVWTVENPSSAPVDLALSVQGEPVCTRRIGAAATTRLDCQDRTTKYRGGGQTIAVTGPSGPWSVSSLEVATLHGRSSSPESIAILPSGSHEYVRPSMLSVVMVWLVLTVVLLAPVTAKPPRWFFRLHTSLTSVVLLLVVVVATSALLSPYTLIVSVGTFVQWLVVLCAWRLWTAIRALVGRGGLALSPAVRPWLERLTLAVGVFVVFGVVVEGQLDHVFNHNYSGFLHISKDAFDHDAIVADQRETIRSKLILEDPGGYDGQWIYFMAFDPLLQTFHSDPKRYDEVVDAPPYRFARIGLSALTRLIARGQWVRFPATIVWIVWLGLVGAALALSEIARTYGRSPWLGALVLVVPGFRLSLGTGLPEPLAAALMMTAIVAAARRRYALAAVCCAVSLLTRETGLICVAAVLGYAAWRGEWRRAFIYGVIAVAPFALWRLYVGVTLHPAWGTQAFFYSPDDIGVPFNGFRELWTAVWHGTYYSYDPAMGRSAIAYPILLTMGLGLAITTTALAFNPCALAAVGYGLLAVSLRFGSIWVHVGNGQRGSFELFLMLAVSWTQSAKWPRWLRIAYGVFAVATAAYVFFGSFDAEATRAGLAELF
jgi:hypothetical protein